MGLRGPRPRVPDSLTVVLKGAVQGAVLRLAYRTPRVRTAVEAAAAARVVPLPARASGRGADAGPNATALGLGAQAILKELRAHGSMQVNDALNTALSVWSRATLLRRIREWRDLANSGRSLRAGSLARPPKAWARRSPDQKVEAAKLIARSIPSSARGYWPVDLPTVIAILDRATSGRFSAEGMPYAERADGVLRVARDLGFLSPSLATKHLQEVGKEISRPVYERKIDPTYSRAVYRPFQFGTRITS